MFTASGRGLCPKLPTPSHTVIKPGNPSPCRNACCRPAPSQGYPLVLFGTAGIGLKYIQLQNPTKPETLIPYPKPLLGGSGVVISGVVSPLTWVISIVTLLISLLISTHEPPSRAL